MTLEVRDLACERGELRLFSGVSIALGAGELLLVGHAKAVKDEFSAEVDHVIALG